MAKRETSDVPDWLLAALARVADLKAEGERQARARIRGRGKGARKTKTR